MAVQIYNQGQSDPNVAAGKTNPPSAIDLHELVWEFMNNQASRFRFNPSIKYTWPVPYAYLVQTSTSTPLPIDISGRFHHYIQATGIAVSSGDSVAIQVSLDGVTWFAPGYYNITTPTTLITSGTGITTNGIYFLTGGFWYIQAVVTPGSNTGNTNVILNSRPD